MLAGWQRLCFKYSEELKPFINDIAPGVLSLIEKVLVPSNDESAECSFDLESVESAISVLEVFLDSFRSAFSPFMQSAARLVAKLCEFQASESIRESAARCVPGLIGCADGDKIAQLNMLRYFITFLLNIASIEYD